MYTLNLTQHNPTDDQLAAGVVNFKEGLVRELLTFEDLPSASALASRVAQLVAVAHEWREIAISQIANATRHTDVPFSNLEIHRAMRPMVMLGGAPFLMAPLHQALKEAGFIPVYAFSARESVETVQPDGSVVKTAVFRHKGFVGGH